MTEGRDGAGHERSGAQREITDLLHAWSEGDALALDRLTALVYDDLHSIAARRLRRERRGHTLEPTALVHEAFLRLVGETHTNWKNRSQFFAVASRVMRRILVDYARARGAGKRGGDRTRVTLSEEVAASADRTVDVLALDEALERLATLDARQAQLVELRFFGGLTIEEAATSLDISATLAKRDWRSARAFLVREMSA